jgi:hypothetical protein
VLPNLPSRRNHRCDLEGGRVLHKLTRAGVLLAVAVLSGGVASAARAAPAAAPAAAVGTLAWKRFADPAENAFTLEVPQGWTVRGGLFRLGFSDARLMVDMTSPDGSINVRLGDVAVPSYVGPSPSHAREGEIYDLGAQAQMVVARYHNGPEFVILYSHARFTGLCRNPQTDAADAGFVFPDYLPSPVPADETSSGQIAYRCDGGHGPGGAAQAKVAYAYARTARFQSIWQATTLGSFLVPAGEIETARAVLARGAKTLELRPEWIQYQKKMDADGLAYQRARQQQRLVALGRQVQQFEAQMRAMQQQVSAFERHQAAQPAQVESFTHVLNGITPTVDPLTGESRIVWTGPAQHYWANGLGDVVNSNTQPSASWHEIVPTR